MTLSEYLKSKPSPDDMFEYLKSNPQNKDFVCKDYSSAICLAAEQSGQPTGMISVHDKDDPKKWGHRMPWWVDSKGNVKLASNADSVHTYGSFESMMNDVRDQQNQNNLLVIQTDSSGIPIQKEDEGKWFYDTFEKVSDFQRKGGIITPPESEQFKGTIFKNL
jgi:hypothetical protein